MEMTTELRISPLDRIGRDRRLDLVKQKAIICLYTADISVLVLLSPWLQEESAQPALRHQTHSLGPYASSRTYNLIQALYITCLTAAGLT